MYCDSEKKGMLAEIKIAESLIKKGYIVSFPFAAKAAYDCLFDDGNKIQKVQVKSGSYKQTDRQSRVSFHTCTFRKNTEGKTISVCRKNEFDYYGVYVEELNQCYLVPTNLVGERQGSLRISGSNGHDLPLAEDYKI